MTRTIRCHFATPNYRASAHPSTICCAVVRATNSQWLAGMSTFCWTSANSMTIGHRKSVTVHFPDLSHASHSFRNYLPHHTSLTSMTNTHGYRMLVRRRFDAVRTAYQSVAPEPRAVRVLRPTRLAGFRTYLIGSNKSMWLARRYDRYPGSESMPCREGLRAGHSPVSTSCRELSERGGAGLRGRCRML